MIVNFFIKNYFTFILWMLMIVHHCSLCFIFNLIYNCNIIVGVLVHFNCLWKIQNTILKFIHDDGEQSLSLNINEAVALAQEQCRILSQNAGVDHCLIFTRLIFQNNW